jgi:RecB family exonuclease
VKPRLFRCSPSSLAAFTDCPRAYWYANLARPRPVKQPLNAYRAVGVAVHGAAAQLWDDPAVPAAELVTAQWPTQAFTDPRRSARWLGRAQGWVTRYASTVDRRRQPAGIERTVATATATLTISGRVDRIDDRGGELILVDLKAGHRPPNPDDARSSMQLAMYALCVARTLRRPCWRVELHHVPTGAGAGAVHDQESLARQISRAADIAIDAQAATDTLEGGAHVDEAFPARPGPLCGHCEWRPHCKAGQAAGPAADPEALLDRWEAAA